MIVRCLALGLCLLAAVAAPAQTDSLEGNKPEAASEKPAKSAGKKAKRAKQGASKHKAAKALAKATPDDPKTTTVEKLPGALKTAHVCAMPNAKVELDSERYAQATVFFVPCTAARGGLTPFAVYVAKDAKGTGAKPVTFEGLKADGTPDTLECCTR